MPSCAILVILSKTTDSGLRLLLYADAIFVYRKTGKLLRIPTPKPLSQLPVLGKGSTQTNKPKLFSFGSKYHFLVSLFLNYFKFHPKNLVFQCDCDCLIIKSAPKALEFFKL